MSQVKRGMTFHSVYCDGNCKWKVINNRAGDVWNCRIIDDLDYNGVEKVFTESYILAAMASTAIYNKIHNESDAYYASLKVGEIIHYNYSFNSFIRCEVVEHEGMNQLKQIALVGEWSEHDLPKYNYAFKAINTIHADKVKEGDIFRPHFGNIYEVSKRGAIDPRNCEPINLELPPLTDEQNRIRLLWEQIETIGDIARHAQGNRRPQDVLNEIQEVLDSDVH